MLNQVSWQQLLAGFGAFGVLLVILFVIFVHNPNLPAEREFRAARHENVFRVIVRDLGQCFSNRNVNLSAVFGGASFGAILAIGVLWGPRLMEARGASPGFAATLTGATWLGLALGAPVVNVISDRWHSRKIPAAVGVLLQGVATALVIYLPLQSNGAAMVLMFSIGFFCGAHMLGFTIAGESVPKALIGSSASIVNGLRFILGGVLQAVPGYLMPNNPQLDDYRRALWIIPAALVIGTIAALFVRETRGRETPATPARGDHTAPVGDTATR